MTPRDRFSGYFPGTKKPPPKDGIKIKKSGTTWWGARWIGALETVLRGDAGRLSRGRTYARAGRTHDLTVEEGQVHAKVTGSSSTPYEITIQLSRLSDALWSHAIDTMASKAQFSAALLAGEMPLEIDQAFHEHKTSLFPTTRKDLKTKCSCPDWGDPCKHVAATHYVLGEALDRDPFLLFELRGRTKAQVLSALRAARGATELEQTDAPLQEIPSIDLGPLTVADYDKPRAARPVLNLTFDAPRGGSSLLHQLGTPVAWHGQTSPAVALTTIVQAAAQHARSVALSDAPADTPVEREAFHPQQKPGRRPRRKPPP